MSVKRCPHCKTRYVADSRASDYVHTCNSDNSVLDNEDKFNLNTNPLVGMANKLAGTTANIVNGKRLVSITQRHNNFLTHTSRQRQVYVDFKDNSWSANPTK